MRALTRKAPMALMVLALWASTAPALGLDGPRPRWGFAPADSASWQGDTLRVSLLAGVAALDSLLIVNDGDELAGPFTLDLLSDLHSASGGRIPASAVSFDPPLVPELAAGASLQLGLGINVSEQTPPEIYRAVLQANGGELPPFAEAVIGLRVRGPETLRVAPNPVFGGRHDRVDFRIATGDGMAVSIEIFTMGMEKVRSLYSDGTLAADGVESLSWDLKNESGRAVAAGVYLALARFEAGDERFQEIHRVMLVR